MYYLKIERDNKKTYLLMTHFNFGCYFFLKKRQIPKYIFQKIEKSGVTKPYFENMHLCHFTWNFFQLKPLVLEGGNGLICSMYNRFRVAQTSSVIMLFLRFFKQISSPKLEMRSPPAKYVKFEERFLETLYQQVYFEPDLEAVFHLH